MKTAHIYNAGDCGMICHQFNYDYRSTYETYFVYYNSQKRERWTYFIGSGALIHEKNINAISA